MPLSSSQVPRDTIAQAPQGEAAPLQDFQTVTVYHGTQKRIPPGGLKVPKWKHSTSSVGLWCSVEFDDVLDYAKENGYVHALVLKARPDQVLTYSSWANAHNAIAFLGGGGNARTGWLNRGIGALKLDRGILTPVEWIMLDPALLTPVSVSRVLGASIQTLWPNPEDARQPTPALPAKPPRP